MPVVIASAPGKVILLGEHAVVYDRPAIAVPVTQVRAKASITANPRGKSGEVRVESSKVNLKSDLYHLDQEHPLRLAIVAVQQTLGVETLPSMNVRISSTIPVASGLGSGAAVSVALIRAISAFLGHPLPDEKVSELAYLVEKKHHGTPSGIDNTVITWAKPVYFNRRLVLQNRSPFEIMTVAEPFTLIIANSGIHSLTSEMVSGVRKRWQSSPAMYESWFDSIASLVEEGRKTIEQGNINALGPLLTSNHGILQKMGVSCLELDRLFETALDAGALGAKLSGGGGGGNMISLATPETAAYIASRLLEAGAVKTYLTHIFPEASS